MGLSAGLLGRRVYLDTNVLIYAIEGFAAFRSDLVDLLRKIEDGSITAATSELTLAEALVRPIAEGKEAVIRAYTEAITSREHFFVLPIDRPVLFKAATLRAGSGMRLPDAIHVATAQLAGMNVFLTNDRGIRLPRPLELRLLSASDAPPPAG